MTSDVSTSVSPTPVAAGDVLGTSAGDTLARKRPPGF
eukprot:CAMPEP_0171868516 /NCGR_PEP_ID=MMETSP0992-20121227/31460_1 /TAXON_ID=483369 /ORGANISM="non described non described, Strain CCMP2098" /LENGTH=36 /DNA_ID= /DNA_START= /DNA_END= /DNA_ORIENTATION=